jgi:hypothetical protein
MSQDIQGGELLKPETAEILKELASEGHQIDGISPKEESPPAKVEPVKEEPKPAEPVAEPEKEKVDAPKKERPTQAVPVNKYNEERHKRQEAEKATAELQEQLKKFSQQPKSTATSDDIKKFAEEIQADPSVIERLVGLARQGSQIPADIAEKLKVLDKYEQLTVQAEEAKAFETDFNKTAEDLTKEGIELTGHKEQIKQLAYTEGYTSASLRAIALEYAHDNGLLSKGKKTLEKGSAGRTVSTETIDFDSISEEQAKALPDDQWEKYVEHKIAKQHQDQGVVGGKHK